MQTSNVINTLKKIIKPQLLNSACLEQVIEYILEVLCPALVTNGEQDQCSVFIVKLSQLMSGQETENFKINACIVLVQTGNLGSLSLENDP
jgi:hypothetical protein